MMSNVTDLLLLQAEVQLNFQKRRGHGLLSVVRPKFSGVFGEALDIAARWSGDVVSFFSPTYIFLFCVVEATYHVLPLAGVWYYL